MVQYLRDKNVSRIAQQKTTKENNAGVSLETKYQTSLVGFENQKQKPQQWPQGKQRRNKPPIRRAALENKAAAQHATLLQEVSLSGEVLKDDDESMSTKLLEIGA